MILYVDKVRDVLWEMERRIENLWQIFQDSYEDIFQDRDTFFTELSEQYSTDIEGISKMQELVRMHMPNFLTPKQKVKKAEEIAMKAHRYQPYGEHKEENDYFNFHLLRVREQALLLSGGTSIYTYKVEITALLHDILEDTSADNAELEKIFGQRIMSAVERLTFRKNEMSKEEYLERIAEDELARIVKAADRIANVSSLNEISDISERRRLFKKYYSQIDDFWDNDIFPKEVEEAFERLRQEDEQLRLFL